MHRVSRRRLLRTSGVAFAAALVPAHAATAAPRPDPDPTRSAGALQAPALRGADLSFTLQVEAAGGRFSDDGQVAPVEQILASRGANWVRQRVWVDPPAGYSDRESALAMARRTRDAGLHLLLDPHYSDFWADPGKQDTPAAWRGQDLRTLAETVRGYTRDLVAAFAAQGTPVDMIQIGNETTGGMLWPTGQIYTGGAERWAEYTTLVKAGIDGAREGAPSGREPRIMLHIDRGGANSDCIYFFEHVLEQGVDFDVIGLSFYPFWHGSMADLSANLSDLAPRFGKDLVVVETSYPWTLADGDRTGNFVTGTGQLPDAGRYPPAPDGQARYLADLAAILASVPGGRGLGFVYWEPEWLPVVGWAPGEGNPNDNLTLFDRSGAALPGLAAFAG